MVMAAEPECQSECSFGLVPEMFGCELPVPAERAVSEDVTDDSVIEVVSKVPPPRKAAAASQAATSNILSAGGQRNCVRGHHRRRLASV